MRMNLITKLKKKMHLQLVLFLCVSIMDAAFGNVIRTDGHIRRTRGLDDKIDDTDDRYDYYGFVLNRPPYQRTRASDDEIDEADDRYDYYGFVLNRPPYQRTRASDDDIDEANDRYDYYSFVLNRPPYQREGPPNYGWCKDCYEGPQRGGPVQEMNNANPRDYYIRDAPPQTSWW